MNRIKGKTERQMAMSAALEAMQEDFLLHSELQAALAANAKMKYDAFIAAGFTDAQAMELLCAAERRP